MSIADNYFPGDSRGGIYFFRQENDDRWLCTIDNACGTSAAQLSETAKR
jgi:hypothetical protein